MLEAEAEYCDRLLANIREIVMARLEDWETEPWDDGAPKPRRLQFSARFWLYVDLDDRGWFFQVYDNKRYDWIDEYPGDRYKTEAAAQVAALKEMIAMARGAIGVDA